MQTTIIFNHETVALDGERYSGCEFRGCRMVFRGGEPPHFAAARGYSAGATCLLPSLAA